MARNLTALEIDNIEDGATILGCGGGGPKWAGEKIRSYLKDKIADGKVIQLAEVEDLSADHLVAVVAIIGSMSSRKTLKDPVAYKPDPQVDHSAEHGAYFDCIVTSFEELDLDVFGQTGKHLTHVMPLEIGLGNSLVPMVVAALKGIPVVDASGAERAIPVLDASTFARAGLRFASTSGILIDPDGNVHRLKAATALETENEVTAVFRDHAVYSHGRVPFGFVALWPTTGTDLKDVVVPRTLDRARHLGSILASAKSTGQSEASTLVEALGADEDDEGIVGLKAVDKHAGRASLAEGTFEVINRTTGETVTVVYANENMLLRHSNGTDVLSPHLICVLRKANEQGREHWSSFTNDTLKDGDDLAVIVAEPDPRCVLPEIQSAVRRVVTQIIDDLKLPPLHDASNGQATL